MPDQIDLFSYTMPRFKIDKPIRLIELFAGIGSQYASLKRLGVNVTPWKVIEWDRFAVASYNAIHGTQFTPQDITQTHAADLEITDTSEYLYILTYSFPCVDLSLAGAGKGLDRESHTRSGLLWEVERILDECTELPQLLLLENVPQLISQKHIKNFWEWRRKLEQLGYTNHVSLLNSKEIGWPCPIPQNRNRCFMVSILGDYYYEFPKKQRLKLRLKDLLEENVDEKYYLSDAMMNYCLGVNQKESKFPRKERFLDNINRANQDIGNAISTNAGNRPVDNFIKVKDGDITSEPFVGTIGNYSPSQHNASRIVDVGGLSPTVMENHNMAFVSEKHIFPCLTPDRAEKRQNGPRFRKEDDEMFTLTAQDIHGVAETNNQWLSQKGVNYVLDPKRGMCTDANANVAQTLMAEGQKNWTGSFVSPDIESVEKSNEIGSKKPTRINLKNGEQITSDQKEKLKGIRIRKLTPKECWRLMGFTDDEYERAAQVVSASQLYKQAGNSIVVNVLSAIFSTMMGGDDAENRSKSI